MSVRPDNLPEIIATVGHWCGSDEDAWEWYYNTPLPAFDFKTADEVYSSGEISALRQYVEHMITGGYA